jgi:hypothetical protein
MEPHRTVTAAAGFTPRRCGDLTRTVVLRRAGRLGWHAAVIRSSTGRILVLLR